MKETEIAFRVGKIQDQLFSILREFRTRLDEPYIYDNVYYAVSQAMKVLDPELHMAVAPGFGFDKDTQEISLTFHRIH